MELTQLRYFAEAAETENLSKAAQNLHISQPTLSKAIHKLEEELGAPLFERNGKRVILNSNGRIFFTQIRPVIDDLQTAGEHFRELSNKRERLVIGVWGASSRYLSCLTDYMQTHGDVTAEVRSGIENITRIDISDFDMLIYSGNDDHFKKYRGFRIAKEKYMLAVHKDSRFSQQAFVKAGELREIRNIRLRPCEEEEYLCRKCGISLHTAADVDSRIMQKELVSAGIGECIVPESESGIFAADRNIRLIDIWDEKFCREINICFKREKLLSENGLGFRQFVLDYYNANIQ